MAKPGNDLGTSDVAAMNDVIQDGQNTFCFRPQQPWVSEMMPILKI